jgi:hypothetical protein
MIPWKDFWETSENERRDSENPPFERPPLPLPVRALIQKRFDERRKHPSDLGSVRRLFLLVMLLLLLIIIILMLEELLLLQDPPQEHHPRVRALWPICPS